MHRCDVLIIGAGPAGSATALALHAHAPALRVTMLGGGQPQVRPVGEVLPALARSLLAHLGAWPAFVQAVFLPVHASAAAWGQQHVIENHFIHSARGHGWHLDRNRFDALLQAQAVAAGTSLLPARRLQTATRTPAGWLVLLDDGSQLAARFLVDASGRQAVLARQLGVVRQRPDKLAAYLAYVPNLPGSDPRTLIEARPDGWWYTAPLPGGERVIACLSDADLGRRSGLQQTQHWQARLAATRWTHAAAGDIALHAASIDVRPAGSARLEHACGDGWLAAGDAASSFDPLSSQGISKALRSGIFAAYALADWLLAADNKGLARYRAVIDVEFADYLRLHAQYYQQEQRWADAPFWQRRHAGRAIAAGTRQLGASAA
ncbi:putative FAD-dependent oxidoreductase LodB [Andreprevotia sp. IGB-42]|uniref:tryptophan 7-halogenase n=1 Tax=Andreprevotia sp. IGB-42 TaxID=2497473 RepID=UPI00135896C5|nr:tryptophan 7-halogenase [Andreprevotia sp. IGB-42]KAF0811745.1 putative FAD-dependent oxidoreductase LodB [Andreprevotia sp. IGB-42]